MEGQTERPEQTWRALCQQAVIEKDVDKLIQLSKEINRLLTEQENQLGLPAVDATFSRARSPLHEGRR